MKTLIACLWVAFAASGAFAAPPPAPAYLAVVEKIAGAIGFLSEDGKLLGEVKVGSFPHEAVLAPDGRLYVSVNGVLWMTEDKEGANTVAVVDTRAMKKVGEIGLGRFHRPHGIALVPGSDRLLATTERPAGLVLIDPATGRVVRDYDVKGRSPHMVIPMPGGRMAFVSDTDSNAVAAIDLATGAVTLIPTGARPQGAVLSPGGDKLYVVNTSGNQISIIDTARLAVTGVIPTGKGPGRIAITPDGRTLVYNLQFEPAVGFADTASGKQTAMVSLTGRPLSLTMTRDGARAFAGIQDQDKVCFVSVAGRKIERVIELPKGSGPDPAIPLGGR
ncbi:MAG: PQQ-binding-like beta-propeller repeat protein [Acidobacteria bacterium]|nr:PQQ-binding-like beta-propeller repeat protein [Acidobacteriota bacterium]